MSINIKNVIDMMGMGDSLSALGISIDDPCDASGLVQAIFDETSALVKEVEESINAISAKAGAGNFIGVVVSILGDMAGAAVGGLMDYFVADMLFGNVFGSIASLITLLMTALRGVELIILYYAATHLSLMLHYRKKLGGLLINELSLLLDFIDAVNNVLGNDNASWTEISAASEYVRAAELRVGFEVGRYNTSKSISLNNINRSIDYIDSAKNALSGGIMEGIKNELNSLHVESGLGPLNDYVYVDTWQGMSIPNFSGFQSYFKDLKAIIAEKYVSSLPPDDPNYEADSLAKKQALFDFIMKLMPMLPKILQALLMTNIVEHASDTLIEKLPIFIALNKKQRKKLNKMLSPPNAAEEIMDSLEPAPQPIFFTDPKTKDLTYQTALTGVKIAEAAILMFPSYWNFLNQTSFLAGTFLRPALDKLKSIRQDMGEWVSGENPGADSIWKVQGKKIAWTTKLSAIKGHLQVLAGNDSLSQSLGINSTQVAEEADDALEKLDILREAITSRHVHADKSPRTIPGDTAFNIAQKYLIMLSSGSVFSLFGKNTHVVGGIQGARIALKAQMQEDQDLINICTSFTKEVEEMTTFPAIKKAFDDMLKSLEGSVAGGLLSDLQNGDLSNLVSQLQNVAALSEMANLLFCLGEYTTGIFADPQALALGTFMGVDLQDKKELAQFKSWWASKEATIDNLKDQQAVLADTTQMVESAIETASGLMSSMETV